MVSESSELAAESDSVESSESESLSEFYGICVMVILLLSLMLVYSGAMWKQRFVVADI